MTFNRIDASKLIHILSSPEKQSNLNVILADNIIFQKVLEHKLENLYGSFPKIFSNKNALEDYVNYLSTCGMFEAPKICVVQFPEKLTQKLWTQCKNVLSRIPTPVEVSAYFFGPISLKNILKETDFPKGSLLSLCYEPNDMDLPKCAHALLMRYKNLSGKSKQEQVELMRLTLESYSNDLLSCEMHFARMEKGNLTFADALAGNPEVNGFHVAEAIAIGDRHLVELRLSQCENCGEEASSVFMAVVYFLKQVAFVLAALEETRNLKMAFEQAKIPYPAQAKLQKAISHLNTERLQRFFKSAPSIEMEMRLQKKPHQYLANEFHLHLFTV